VTRISVLGLTALALSLAAGAYAGAQTQRTTDRPDAGPGLLDPNIPRPAANTEQNRATPPPRSLDSKRAPVPDRLALPEDLQDIPLAPPTPPVPQNGGNKTGGGPNRVQEIFKNPGGGEDIPRGAATRTPEDMVAPPTPRL
jgi:hypothetical protein